MPGFGVAPYGVGISGLTGVPPSLGEPGAVPGVAFINQDGDYECDTIGDLVKTSPTKQRALLLLRTQLGSVWADTSLGLERVEAVTASWEYRMRRSAEAALRPMVDDGTIRIDEIVITRTLHFRGSITAIYTVLATGEQEIATV